MLPGDFVFIALLAGLLVLVGIYYMQHQSNRSFVNEQLARAQIYGIREAAKSPPGYMRAY